MGYPGDPVADNPNIKVKRPSWTKDGTMLVFRQLSQDVVGFEKYVAEKGKDLESSIPEGAQAKGFNPSDIDGPGLFGARLVGRWKSVRSSSSALHLLSRRLIFLDYRARHLRCALS